MEEKDAHFLFQQLAHNHEFVSHEDFNRHFSTFFEHDVGKGKEDKAEALEKRIHKALSELRMSLRTFFREDLTKEEVPVVRLKDLLAALGVSASDKELEQYLSFKKLSTIKGFKLVPFIQT